MQVIKKLIVESPNYEYDFFTEEKNLNEPLKWYISGPQMAHSTFNKNNRKYLKEEMDEQVKIYKEEKIDKKRSWGELEHSSLPSVSLKDAADLLLTLEAEGNYYIGKSLVMDTPQGKILQAILASGSKPGRSTRSLGQLKECVGGNVVTGLQLIAVDTVADPSTSDAFVDGILESKEFICNSNGLYEKNYESFEKKLTAYPSHRRNEINDYVLQEVKRMLKSF